ncbi:MAG: protein-glutamine glutaminase family protein [Ginsengibacter sp.]
MIIKTLYHQVLSDEIETDKVITKEQAEKLFAYFKNCTTFRWLDANNNCEDRANAICILLDEWNIQNGKGWVFSGYVFKKTGYLKNLWKYHVAALVPVKEGAVIKYYIIDPATSDKLILIEDWAANITDNPHSYYLIKKGDYYIFNAGKIEKGNWFERNKRNYNWTIQGLSGINGVSSKGKAQLVFNKKKVLKTEASFKELKKLKPAL